MNVVLNNNPLSIADNSSLYELLTEHSLTEKKGIAVAVNNKVIFKSKWKDHQLNQNDKITIITATQGG